MKDYLCLACGEELNTVKKKVWRRGDCYTGRYETEIDFYDRTQDAWFLRVANPDVLTGVYKSYASSLEVDEVENLVKDARSKLANNEFSDMVFISKSSEMMSKIGEIQRKYEIKLSGFEKFMRFFGTSFEECKKWGHQPRYGTHAPCLSPVLENVSEKGKYVVESGKERLLKGKATLSVEDFAKTFHYLSSQLEIQPSQDVLSLEFQHFSESEI